MGVLRVLLPFVPNLATLIALSAACATLTVPLFRWAHVPLALLLSTAATAVALVWCVAVYNAAALGYALGSALGIVNILLMVHVFAETIPMTQGRLRGRMYRLLTGTLPAALVPQIVLLVLIDGMGEWIPLRNDTFCPTMIQ